MRTLLKLQHHRHTAKHLPHHHTSYRGLFLIAAIFALSLTLIQRTTAADLDVSARVAAPIPATAPSVTSHSNGNAVNDPVVTLSGTCEVTMPAYSVTVFNDGQFVGSTPCAPDGSFSVGVTLHEGQNSLTLSSRTITDDTGPISQPLILNYNAPTEEPSVSPGEETKNPTSPSTAVKRPSGTSSRGTATDPSAPPRIVFGETTYLVYTPNQIMTLTYEILDGTAPYRISINWGDGSPVEDINHDGPGKYTAEHAYARVGTFTATLVLVDKSERSTQISLAALTFARPELSVSSNTSTTSGGITANLVTDNLFIYAWSAYGVVALTILSLWIGDLHRGSSTLATARVRTAHHKRVRH